MSTVTATAAAAAVVGMTHAVQSVQSSEEDTAHIDSEGFRANVGIMICNRQGGLLWARRAGKGGWQFPQGGIKRDESPKQALFRELQEEVGLNESDVTVISQTVDWLRYRLPERFIRHNMLPLCIGQKQLWFLLGLEAEDERIALGCSDAPEFDAWRWVDYWYPAEHVIAFKRDVYRRALQEFEQPFNAYQAG